MQLDPKTSMILGIVATVILVTGASSADLTAIFGPQTAGVIIHVCAWLGAIFTAVLTMLHATSPAAPGPMAPK